MLLWAWDLGEPWKFFPAAFCFAVVGLLFLPKALALVCGYFVGFTVIGISGWFLWQALNGKGELANALRFAGFFGLGALMLVVSGRLPWRS